jgi:hypothetical protein
MGFLVISASHEGGSSPVGQVDSFRGAIAASAAIHVVGMSGGVGLPFCRNTNA